ncbi:hypothetical protein [Vibrio mediterranei]|uniref:Uncharacterized protein n=1 Tax=Vibrio mediterranei TaxID=689 RepID=A0ABX5D622_9VIBR|nr:hypothetical protein [Vibrio mediterranei]MCG9659924.1 hypothetical protein [Vibrio mediterranei]PRQ65139.1 hypothetical protein COR51_23750 [Vibrio mediterranei]
MSVAISQDVQIYAQSVGLRHKLKASKSIRKIVRESQALRKAIAEVRERKAARHYYHNTIQDLFDKGLGLQVRAICHSRHFYTYSELQQLAVSLGEHSILSNWQVSLVASATFTGAIIMTCHDVVCPAVIFEATERGFRPVGFDFDYQAR